MNVLETFPEAIADFGDKIISRLKTVYDPEIPVNVFDLGLIYKIDVDPTENGKFKVAIDMTLTTPNCPIADQIPVMVKTAALSTEGAGEVTVSLVWDPPWDKSMLSDEARMMLDMW